MSDWEAPPKLEEAFRFLEAERQEEAVRASLRGVSRLSQYARIVGDDVAGSRTGWMPVFVAAVAREAAGLRASLARVDWVTTTWQRLLAYPPDANLPWDIRDDLHQMVDIVLTVVDEPGLMPAQARLRLQCAAALLLLGDEGGDMIRRRVGHRQHGAWRIAPDLVQASKRSGLPPDEADHFMGTPSGFFRRCLDELSAEPAGLQSAEARPLRLSYWPWRSS